MLELPFRARSALELGVEDGEPEPPVREDVRDDPHRVADVRLRPELAPERAAERRPAPAHSPRQLPQPSEQPPGRAAHDEPAATPRDPRRYAVDQPRASPGPKRWELLGDAEPA